MKLKKTGKNIILAVFCVSTIFLNNTAFAESVLGVGFKQQNNIDNIKTVSPIYPDIIQGKFFVANEPSIELKPDKTKEKKHFIPVLELKGGVKSEKIPEEKESSIKNWMNGDYATGNWMGLRTRLEDHGITITGSYTNDGFMKLHGGINSKIPVKYLGLVNSNLELDTKKLGLWSGGKFNVQFLNKHGQGLSRDYVGDVQIFDNADTQSFAQLNTYWYEQDLFRDRFKIKLGKQDANDEFCSFNTGGNFINSSYGYMPMIPLATYPNAGLGVVATVEPVDWFYVKSGWFDGDPRGGRSGFDTAFSGKDSVFFIEQTGITHKIKNYPGNYFAGYWLRTEHTDELSNAAAPKTFGQNTGWYMTAEQMIFKENKSQDDDQGLTVFGQFAWAPSNRNEIARYYGAGLSYKGLIPKRNNDFTGIGAAIANFSGCLKNIPDDGRGGSEIALEMFHKVQLTPWLAVQPDMQIIFNPDGQYKNAFVIGLRSSISF